MQAKSATAGLHRLHLSLPTHPKIKVPHLSRAAYVYVRQSTPKQVQHNRESQLYQYQLAERAVALGWSKEQVIVIDSDLGLSGTRSDGRDGYKTLIAEVSLGKVGIIFRGHD
jgi:DNA invertase Pin-like site-specific DNA recombinase